jgi:hypothetical protein
MASTQQVNKLKVSLSTTSTYRNAQDKIVVSRKQEEKRITQELDISFQRTVRVADNGTMNSLPPSLGSFPIYSTAEYAHTLPGSFAETDGFFISMYRKIASNPYVPLYH